MYRTARHSAPAILELVRHLRFSEACKLMARNTASRKQFYLLSCALDGLPQVEPRKLGGDELCLLTPEDLPLLYNQIAALSYDDKRDLLSRILFFNVGFKHCHIIKENGVVAHLQWLVFPSENDLLKRVYKSRFLPLRKHQVMIENAFTFPAYRGRGFFPYVTQQMLRSARQQGYTQAVTYARTDSLNVINNLAQMNFKLAHIVPEYKLFGHTWRAWGPAVSSY